MHHPYAILALDIARERAAEAAARRQAKLATAGQPGAVRRSLAEGLALVARGAAAAVRRLDACRADDLVRSMTPR